MSLGALAGLRDEGGSRLAATDAFRLMAELFPICRSITGDGLRETLRRISEHLPLDLVEVPSGTVTFDWEIPPEWNVREAYVATAADGKVIDFRNNTLHLVSYSVPFRGVVSREELELHLHSLPGQPDLIPYRTSYYHRDWGFCLAHRDRLRLGSGPFEVVVNTTLAPGSLTYGECRITGESDREALIYTHACHPSMANDNLTGIAVAAVLAKALSADRPRMSWRIVLGPGTIGSLAWLSKNEDSLGRLTAGLVIGLLGDAAPLTFKRSRRGDTVTDRAMELVLASRGSQGRIVPFAPYGYDERQFCSPGFDLAVGRLTRGPEASFPEYHTSADNLDFVRLEAIAESISVLAEAIQTLDSNVVPVNLQPKGERRLGSRGLYGPVGGVSPRDVELAMLWVLNLGDGRHDLVEMARRSGFRFGAVAHAAEALRAAGLIEFREAAGTALREGCE